VQFFSSIRKVIAAEPPPSGTALGGFDADAEKQAFLELVRGWQDAPVVSKAAVIGAIDVWLLRLSVEWDIDQN
jgi:hypothetical protein